MRCHELRLLVREVTGMGLIYPHSIAKVQMNGRSMEERHHVMTWLTGFDETQVQEAIVLHWTCAEFFDKATHSPYPHLITGAL
ncbi:MAG: hypothetical protein RhofKO_34710 [Rhodothermales bacterium]